MKAALLLILAILLCYAPLVLMAQADSTFVRYFPLSSYYGQAFNHTLNPANLLETYDGRFCLQMKGYYQTPGPITLIDQSPIMLIGRDGYSTSMIGGPYDNMGEMIGQRYYNIIKDNDGGYLALSAPYDVIARLSSDFDYLSSFSVFTLDNIEVYVDDILKVTDGYIVIGWNYLTHCTYTVKYDNSFTLIWEHRLLGVSSLNYFYSLYKRMKVKITSDGGYLFYGWSGIADGTVIMKTNAEGDSLWTTHTEFMLCDVVETNHRYFGCAYTYVSSGVGQLDVYDFGENFSVADSLAQHITIPTYDLEYSDEIQMVSIERLSDSNLLLAVSTPNGELFKFDADLNLIWSSHYLGNERFYYGRRPFIELSNGDILYTALNKDWSSFDTVTLVRVDTSGHATPIEDNNQTSYSDLPFKAYPNPFVNNAVISYNLPKQTQVKMDVYNIKGQWVRSLENRVKDSGSQTVNWDGTNDRGLALPTGIYFCRLVTPEQVQTHKLVLLK